MLTVQKIACDFPVELWVVKQEVAVVESADVDHGWLLSVVDGGENKKAQPWES